MDSAGWEGTSKVFPSIIRRKLKVFASSFGTAGRYGALRGEIRREQAWGLEEGKGKLRAKLGL